MLSDLNSNPNNLINKILLTSVFLVDCLMC